MKRSSAPSFLRRVVAKWADLTSPQRRRIVLGVLLTLSVAAWDLVLFVVVGSLFALSEIVPARRPIARAT